MSESTSVEVINLAKSAFSTMQNNFGLIKFSIETLEQDKKKPQIWNLVCTFYENLGSFQPSKYKAVIDSKKQTVTIRKIEGPEEIERKFVIKEEGLSLPNTKKTAKKVRIGKTPPVAKKIK